MQMSKVVLPANYLLVFLLIIPACSAQTLQRFGDTLFVHTAANSIPFNTGFLYASSGTDHPDSSIGIVLYRFADYSSDAPDSVVLIRDSQFLLAPAWIGRISSDSLLIVATEYPFQQPSKGWLYWLDNQLQVARRKELSYAGKNLQLQWGAVASSGTIYLSGSITQDDALGNDLYLACLDPDGSLRWDRSLGGPGNEKGHKVVLGNNGRVYASADSEQGSVMNAVFCHDTLGNFEWQRFIGDANENGTQYLHFSEGDQRLYMCGESTTSAGPAFSLYMVSLLLTGETERTAYVGGAGTEAAFFMRPDVASASKLWMCGYTNSYAAGSPISPFLAGISTDFSQVEAISFPVGEVSIAKNFHFLGGDSVLLIAEGQSGHWIGRVSRTDLNDSLFVVQQVELNIVPAAFEGVSVSVNSGSLHISGLRSDLPVRLSWYDSAGRLLRSRDWEAGAFSVSDSIAGRGACIWVVQQPGGLGYSGKLMWD
jgi:hypothetical protein